LLREQAGEDTSALGEWWTRYQYANAEDKEQMVKDLGPDKKPRRRRKRKPSSSEKSTKSSNAKSSNETLNTSGNHDAS